MPSSLRGEGRNACGELRLNHRDFLSDLLDGHPKLAKLLAPINLEVFAGACTITSGVRSKQC